MKKNGGFDRAILLGAMRDAFGKLDPRTQVKNPVIIPHCQIAAIRAERVARHK